MGSLLYNTILSSEYSSSSEESSSSSSSATPPQCMSEHPSHIASRLLTCAPSPTNVEMNPAQPTNNWVTLGTMLTSLTNSVQGLVNYVSGREATITAAATSLQASAEANQAAAEALEAKVDPKPKTKAEKPDPYHGEPAKAVAFIQEMEFYFRSAKEKDVLQKIMVTLSLIRGGTNDIASTWANGQRELIINAGDNTVYDEFKDFKKAFLNHFQWGDIQGNSIEIIRTMTMGTKTCEEYTTLFRTHETRSKLGEVALIEEYKCGLNQSLWAKIFNLDPMPTDLKGWQNKACQLDKQHQQEKHYRDLYNPTASKPKVAAQPAKPAFVPRPTFTPTPVAANPFVPRRDPNAMDVDRARIMADGLCFYCKEKGHTKFMCPLLKNKKPSYTTCTVDVAGMSSEERSVLLRQLQDFQEDQ
jgi:Retrotransposon gag protein